MPEPRELVVWFVVLPAIGALHGWFTNFVALRLLFRPAREVRFLGLRFLGVLHRRKDALAEAIGGIVEGELLRFEDVRAHLSSGDALASLSSAISKAVAARVASALPAVLPARLRESLAGLLEGRLTREVALIIEGFLSGPEGGALLAGRVAPIVAERIRSLDVAGLERVVVKAAGNEMRWIERLGFIMGWAIGMVQGVFLLALRLASLY